MSKIITITAAAVRELSIDQFPISESVMGWRVTALYEWVDDGGNKVSHKRISIYPPGVGQSPNMPPGAQTKLTDLVTAIENFIKQQDGI